ncbi:MAG: isochorismatase family cysteine hydrolase [Euryarchaeota archaeon]|nr:isochorismatase family cysteine hydrolase [Euryarchaeota archaeon]
MLKQRYISFDNIRTKSDNWLNEIKPYSRDFHKSSGKVALLVIDMQKFFLKKESHAFIPAAQVILPNITRLILEFSTRDLPIVFTRLALDAEAGMMSRWWNDTVIEGTESSEIVDDLDTDKGRVIRKIKYSAFRDTQLNSFLKKENVKNVVVTGVMTHLCCDTTARDAFMNDFNVYFVVDATASYNEDLHLSALKALAHGFMSPVKTGDMIETL